MTMTVKKQRSDGRAPGELRPIQLHVGYQDAGEGSVLIEQGKTRILCTASVEHAQPPHLKGSDKGWITAEYGMLPRANPHRRAMRESVTGHRKGRTFEIERMIGRALRTAADLKSIGPRTIYVDCDVLRADGSTRTASVVGGFLALAQAFQRGVATGQFKKMPLRAYVAAVSVGLVDGKPMIDLSYDEDSKAQVDMNVVWTSEGKLADIEAAGEGHSFEESELSEMLALSRAAVEKVFELQKQSLPIEFPSQP